MHSYAWKWQLPDPRQSLKVGWAILEVLPLRRPSNKRETTRKPHFGAPRQIQHGQHIHSSVLALMKARESEPHLEKGISYATQARLPLDLELSWGDLVEGHGSEFIEPDPFSDFAALPLYNIQNATSLRDLPRLQSEIAKLATNITAENIPKSLAEVPDALPMLLSALDFMSTQVDIQGNNVAALFSVLALFPPDVKHKRTLPMFRGIAQKALNTPHVQFDRGVLRHATGIFQFEF
ncbi:hypothetical protein EYR40_006058 [Pleurotus pulmonarius]|nr:hypothetical protein EYR36_005562 [Pleurotus pulmonarius]KAF4602840.1 hypothetical protein EYR40_006058 [Pleurotus pulmonarius]